MRSSSSTNALARVSNTTSPADAEILIDDVLVGRTPVEGHRRFRSGPLLVRDLSPGVHRIAARRADAEPATRELTLQPGTQQHLHLVIWHPEEVLRTVDGRILRGMVVEQTPDFVDFATSPTAVERIAASQIAVNRPTLQPRLQPPLEPQLRDKSGTPGYLIEPFPENADDKP